MQLSSKQRRLIQDFVGESDCDIEIRFKYSGRMMYGKECFGLVIEQLGNSYTQLMRLAVKLSEANEETLLDRITNNVRADNMGMDAIIYFPGVEWGADDEEEEECEFCGEADCDGSCEEDTEEVAETVETAAK